MRFLQDTVRALLALWLVLAPVKAWAGSMTLLGVGGGTAASYTGPGDTFATSPYAAYSCAEAFTAAYASTNGNLCDLVDSAAPTTVICTLKSLATGKADLASASCTGSVTPAVKCAAATGGVCNISKAYDQTGNGRDQIQTTAANQPTLTFSSTPTGTLPAINCGNGTPSIFLSATVTSQAQPLTAFSVYNRSAAQVGGIIGEAGGGNIFLGGNTSANTALVQTPSALSATASDNSWNAVSTLASSTSSVVNVMSTETNGNAGTGGLGTTLRVCRGSSQFGGLVAEVILYAATSNTTNRNALITNARSSGRYNF